LAQVQAHRIFLPPASPQLNPLDSIFTTLKHRLQKRDIRTLADLQELINKNMIEISKESTEIYFKDVVNSLERSKTDENL
jgi:transposase